MTELLLIFIGAAYLENLVLLIFFDAAIDTSAKTSYGIFAIAGSLLVLATTLHEIPHSWQVPEQAATDLYD